MNAQNIEAEPGGLGQRWFRTADATWYFERSKYVGR